jgi:hypothetical protein
MAEARGLGNREIRSFGKGRCSYGEWIRDRTRPFIKVSGNQEAEGNIFMH